VNPLRVLIIEDSEDDALLLLRELTRGGFDPMVERVDTREDMVAALDRQIWDIILCDYVMPRFSGLHALALLKEKSLDVPFIIVSGRIGEEPAVEAMRAGAHDFVMKNNLSRLLPVVERELRESRENARLAKEAQEATKMREETQAQLNLLLAAAPVGMAFWDRSLRYIRVNDALATMYGIPAESHVGRQVDEVLAEMSATVEPILKRVLETGIPVTDMEINSETATPGQWRHWLASYFPVRAADGHVLGVGAVVVEITERKRAEEEHARVLMSEREARRELQAAVESLRSREDEFRNITNSVPALIAYVDRDQRYRFNNQAFNEWFGSAAPRQIRGRHLKDILGEKAYEAVRPHVEAALQGRKVSYETWIPYKDGGPRYVSASYTPHFGRDGQVEGYVALYVDNTPHKLEREQLRADIEEFRKKTEVLT